MVYSLNNIATDIILFLSNEKCSSLYRISDGIHRKPKEFSSILELLVGHNIILVNRIFGIEVFSLSGQGYDVVKNIRWYPESLFGI